MIELLKEIPGPYFLLVYAVYSLIVICITFWIARNDSTKNLEIPEPTNFAPIDIALLSKGINGAIILSAYNLWRKKKIKIEDNKGFVILKKASDGIEGLSNLESFMFKKLWMQTNLKEFLIPKSINEIEKSLKKNKQNLENKKLLPDDDIKKRYILITMIGLFFLLSLGGIKMFLGINRGNQSDFSLC